ncbi:glycerophosphodiester phosphodiesterase [uncultured Anaerovibrio sp.]|uniref:glycerophosphodiester phosphodiesterase n=1 Tax=uncultured Anaerovibrio sp. TaxID=361586 RepID=UPI00262A7C84|nr:glycerophosphodiester phosphodiesterase [uncultured Anaerovibrio sp.]
MIKTKIWAHRGASGWDKQYAPENTMPAFERAIKMGADGIETDVQLTKDGVLVLCHDESIERVSDGYGWIKDYTLEELRGFSFSKTHPEFGRVEIPTLEDLLYLLKNTNLELNIELKSSVIYYHGLEENTADFVHKMGMDERVIYSTFNHYSLKKAKAYCMEKGYKSRFGVLSGKVIGRSAEYVHSLGADAYHPSASDMNERVLKECQARGIKVNLWTIDMKSEIKRWADAGADAIITDCPDSGRRVVDGDISWWRG